MGETISKNKSSSDIIQQLNIFNAKIVACLLVIAMVIYHGILHLTNGVDTCQWLLTKGRFQGNYVWQPFGCMLHKYSYIDSKRCLRYSGYLGHNNRITFIGDSRIREMFTAVLNTIEETVEPSNFHSDLEPGASLGDGKAQQSWLFVSQPRNYSKSFQNEELRSHRKRDVSESVSNKHKNLLYTNKLLKLRLEFYWQPMLNSTLKDLLDSWAAKPDRPSVVVLGGATWYIRTYNATPEGLLYYTGNLTTVAKSLDRLAGTGSKVLWAVQPPVVEELLSPPRQSISNELIDDYNDASQDILRYTNVTLWSSASKVGLGLSASKYSVDGLHFTDLYLGFISQIFMNMYCNDLMNFNDGTCCSSAERITTLQILTFTALGLCLVTTITFKLGGHAVSRSRQHRSLQQNGTNSINAETGDVAQSPKLQTVTPWKTILSAMAKLAVIMFYFYICDRTNFFMKENKYFSELHFWLPLAYVFVLGLFFTEESRFTRILHRDQTDEWKGWMQLVILIYHMTGASQVIPLYMHVRVLVSSYLFLTGYGHFCYFWQTGDSSFARFCQVLFRMNFMTVILCLCMNRPYQFYYFVPLVSFLYLVVYVTLVLPKRITAASSEAAPIEYLYVVIKLVGVFSCITILYLSEVFFEKVFVTRPWKALFVTSDDDIHEWWFRWSLDRYSVCFGMAFAFLYLVAQRYGFLDDHNHGNLFSRGRSLAVTFLACIGLGSYTAFTFLCHNKAECNEVHPYVVFIPIVSFVLLRNVSGVLRTRYSTFFAWFGRISLELFIGQYHIWLAADTHGLLVLIPGSPVANVIVTSFIFVCIAHEVHQITGVLVTYAVPADWKTALRNLVLFFLALVPIGIHDGMF